MVGSVFTCGVYSNLTSHAYRGETKENEIQIKPISEHQVRHPFPNGSF